MPIVPIDIAIENNRKINENRFDSIYYELKEFIAELHNGNEICK